MEDWRRTVEHAISLEPDHVSAYALIVEAGTAFARKVSRGEVVMPDDDETADKYLLADSMLEEAGLAMKKREGRGYNDRFHGRITFPLCDGRGMVRGFGARAMEEGQPSSVNNAIVSSTAEATLVVSSPALACSGSSSSSASGGGVWKAGW